MRNEGDGKAEVTLAVLDGTLSEGVTVTVSYSTSNGEAISGSDYMTATGIVTLSSTTTSVILNVPLTNDELLENDETFEIVLSAFDGGLPDRVTLDPMTAMVTIMDDDTATIGFVLTSYEILENGGQQEVEIEIKSGTLAEGVTVAVIVSTEDGTATTLGGDYIPTMRTRILSSMTTQAFITIPINLDRLAEGKERFGVVLSLPADSSLSDRIILDPMTATVTITDELILTIGFVNEPYFVSEEAGGVSVAVGILSEGVMPGDGIVLTATYVITDVSALAGEDYQRVTSILSFEAATSTQEIFIPITDDSLFEGDELFRITLTDVEASLRGVPLGTDAPTVQLNPQTALVTILDDDIVEIGFEPVTYEVGEGSGTVTLTARLLNGSLGRVVTLTYATADDSARAGEDYSFSTGTVTLSPGVTEETFTISLIDDVLYENTETFTVVLSGAPVGVVLTNTVAFVTITDDEPAPVAEIGFDSVTYSVSEEVSRTVLTVSVISGVLLETVTLSYTTVDGSALSGEDYELSTGAIELSPLDVTATIEIAVLDDRVSEGTEVFFVSLGRVSVPDSVLLTLDRASVTIEDTDVEVGFEPVTYSVGEASGTVELRVSVLSGDLTESVTLNYETSDGSAVAGTDYTLTTGTLTLSDTISSFTFTVTILEDIDVEPVQTFTVTLSVVDILPAGVALTSLVAVVTIIDNDEASVVPELPEVVVVTPTLSPSSVTLSEGGTVSLEIVLESASSVDVTLTLVLENEVDGVTTSDYSLTPSEVFISAGTTSTLVLLTALDDPDLEGEERFDLRLVSASSGVTVSVGSILAVTILESDQPAEVLPVVVVVTPTLSPSSVTLSEGGTVSLEIVLESASSVDVTLTLVLENEVDGVTTGDYSLTPSEVFISAGTTSTLVLLTALDDPDLEGEERFDLRLVSASSGVTVSVGSVVTVTILESDQPVEVVPVVVVVTPTLSPSSVTLSEGGTVSLEIVLESASSVDVTLTLVLENEVDGVTTGDYSLTPSEVFISAGTTSTLVLLTALDDPDLEGEERFDLRLVSASSGVTVSVGSVVTVTILESDQPVEVLPVVVVVTPTLSPSSVTLSEGGTVSLEIVLESASSVDVTLTLVLENEVDGVTTGDYSLTPSEVFISAGTTSTLVLLTALDDPDLEGEERFDLRLVSASSGVTVSVGSVVTVTILESDQPVEVLPVVVVVTPTLSPSSVTLSEGGTVSLEIVLESASSVDVTLTLVLENEVDGVTTGDYSLTPSEVFISAGTTSTLVLLTALDDPDLEGEERFDLRLVSASSGVTVSVGSVVTVTILESDQPVEVLPVVVVVTPTLSPSSVTLSEGGTVSLEIVLESASSVDVTLTLVLENEVDGVTTGDYSLTPSEVFISAGTTSTLVLLTALDDPDLEGEERFDLRLVSASSGVTVSVGSIVTVTILESDQPVEVLPVVVVVTPTLSPSSVTLSEGGTVSLEIVLESASSVDVTLTLVLENEVDGVTTGDYSLTPSEVFISAGTTSTLVLLTALDDPDLEGEERFDLRLVSASSGVTVSVGSVVTVTILESDQPVEVVPVVVVVTPTLSPSSVTLSEGGTVSLEIVLESASSVDVTLTLVLENEVDGVTTSDYSLTPSEVFISAGTTSTLVLLTALDDPDLEGEERFDLRLVSASSGVTVSVGSIVTVTILESDQPVEVLPVVVVVTPTLSPSSVTLSEGGTVSLEIVLESASSVDVTLTLVLENEVDGVTTGDYSLTPSEVFISAGTTSTLVLLTALDDPDLEGEERFDLRLVSASSGVTVSVGSIVTVTILESDQPVDVTPEVIVVTPTLSPSSVTLSEGGTVSLEIVLESASSVDVTLTLVLENEVGGVTASDYSLTPSEVFISAGTTSTLVLLTALDDPDLEGEERFDLRLVSASSGVTVSVGSIVTVTILESDQPVDVTPEVIVVTPTLSPSSVTLSEGGTVSLEIVLESASSVDVTLTLVLENEVDGVTTSDYSLTPSEVFISAGTTSTLVLLTALDDPDLEGEERFDLRLVSASSGVTVAVGSVVTVTILESDQPVDITPGVEIVTPTISPSSVTLSEGGTVSLEIVLESASSVDVTLTLVLENEVDGVTTGDYSLTPSEVFISAGTTSTLVLLTALDDPDLEGEERFDLRLVSASSGVTVSVGSIVTVTILESDQPVDVTPEVIVVTPTLSPSSVTLSEGGTVSLEIVLESASSVDVTLTLVLENEVDGVTTSDYSLTPSEVFISAGTTSTLVLLDGIG